MTTNGLILATSRLNALNAETAQIQARMARAEVDDERSRSQNMSKTVTILSEENDRLSCQLKNIKKESRDLLFTIALKSKSLQNTVEEIKKRWPEKAEEVESIYQKELIDVENDQDYTQQLKDRIVARIK